MGLTHKGVSLTQAFLCVGETSVLGRQRHPEGCREDHQSGAVFQLARNPVGILFYHDSGLSVGRQSIERVHWA